jgi:tRNA(Ile2) C34 agmatinyltransferase TiaS
MTEVLNVTTPAFLGIKDTSCINALLKLPSAIKLLENFHDVLFKTSQHFWKKAIVNLSGPGPL